MKSADHQLHEFLYGLLNTPDFPCPTYDDVPQDAVFPYLSIGDTSAAQIDDSCNRRWQIGCEIHTWSRETGMKEVKEIQAAVDERLAYASGFTDDFFIVTINPDTVNVFRDPDGATRHGVQLFTAIVVEV